MIAIEVFERIGNILDRSGSCRIYIFIDLNRGGVQYGQGSRCWLLF